MIKMCYNTLKKIVFSGFLLYGYNILSTPLNIPIPINVVTILIVSILGFPALLSLIFIHIIVF